NAVLFQALRVVVEKGHDGATQGNAGHSGGGVEAGNHPDQVANQDEESQRDQESGIAFAVRADDLMALVFDERFKSFHDVLQAAGMIVGKAAAYQDKQSDDKRGHQNLHGHKVSNGSVRVDRRNAQRPHGGVHRASEQSVQECGKPQLFWHADENYRAQLLLEPVPQGGVKLVSGFTQDCRNGQKQARKQAVQAGGRNFEYSIGGNRHQKIAPQKTQHDPRAGRAFARGGDFVRQCCDRAFQPIKIQVSDGAADQKSQGHLQTKAQQNQHSHRDG